MSTTVTYKGSTIATVSNATKTLGTSGKWMEGDITLTDSTTRLVTSSVAVPTGHINSLTFPVDGEPTFLMLVLSSSLSSNTTFFSTVYFDGEDCVCGAVSYLSGSSTPIRFAYYNATTAYDNGTFTIATQYTWFPSQADYTLVYAYEP